MIKLNPQIKRNFLKAILGSILVSILPLIIFKDIKLFLQYFTIVFPGVFIGNLLIDLIGRYLTLKKGIETK